METEIEEDEESEIEKDEVGETKIEEAKGEETEIEEDEGKGAWQSRKSATMALYCNAIHYNTIFLLR